MPITRYATHLKLRGEYERYRELLAENFNAATLDQVMCRNLISIGWDGSVYDCDFNQMLDLPLARRRRQTLNIGVAGARASRRPADHRRRPLLRLHRRCRQQLRRRAGLAERSRILGGPAVFE